MTVQMQATPSTKKISEIYTRLTSQNPTLILQPSFQRRLVWSNEHKEKFIDTILKGLPIPEIYIAQSGIDLDKIETQEVVVDGQQRLSTIVQYINEPEGSIVFGKIVPKFKDLVEKRDFLNYNIVVRDLGDIESDRIIEIFKRINSTQYGLNDIELQNAIYDGAFISTAKEILDVISVRELPFLTESKISRMEDLYYLLLIITTIVHGGYFSLDSEIENYVVRYNDAFEGADEYKTKIIENFKEIEALNLPIDSIWYRKSNYFTLFVEVYRNREAIELENLKERLIQFEENILRNKDKGREENDFSRYYAYMYSGTNGRKARVIRSELFAKHVIS